MPQQPLTNPLRADQLPPAPPVRTARGAAAMAPEWHGSVLSPETRQSLVNWFLPEIPINRSFPRIPGQPLNPPQVGLAQIARGAMRAPAEAGLEMATDPNMVITGAMLGPAGAFIQRLVALGFAADTALSLYNSRKDIQDAVNSGDLDTATNAAAHALIAAGMGTTAAVHGAQGAPSAAMRWGRQYMERITPELMPYMTGQTAGAVFVPGQFAMSPERATSERTMLERMAGTMEQTGRPDQAQEYRYQAGKVGGPQRETTYSTPGGVTRIGEDITYPEEAARLLQQRPAGLTQPPAAGERAGQVMTAEQIRTTKAPVYTFSEGEPREVHVMPNATVRKGAESWMAPSPEDSAMLENVLKYNADQPVTIHFYYPTKEGTFIHATEEVPAGQSGPARLKRERIVEAVKDQSRWTPGEAAWAIPKYLENLPDTDRILKEARKRQTGISTRELAAVQANQARRAKVLEERIAATQRDPLKERVVEGAPPREPVTFPPEAEQGFITTPSQDMKVEMQQTPEAAPTPAPAGSSPSLERMMAFAKFLTDSGQAVPPELTQAIMQRGMAEFGLQQGTPPPVTPTAKPAKKPRGLDAADRAKNVTSAGSAERVVTPELPAVQKSEVPPATTPLVAETPTPTSTAAPTATPPVAPHTIDFGKPKGKFAYNEEGVTPALDSKGKLRTLSDGTPLVMLKGVDGRVHGPVSAKWLNEQRTKAGLKEVETGGFTGKQTPKQAETATKTAAIKEAELPKEGDTLALRKWVEDRLKSGQPVTLTRSVRDPKSGLRSTHTLGQVEQVGFKKNQYTGKLYPAARYFPEGAAKPFEVDISGFQVDKQGNILASKGRSGSYSEELDQWVPDPAPQRMRTKSGEEVLVYPGHESVPSAAVTSRIKGLRNRIEILDNKMKDVVGWGRRAPGQNVNLADLTPEMQKELHKELADFEKTQRTAERLARGEESDEPLAMAQQVTNRTPAAVYRGLERLKEMAEQQLAAAENEAETGPRFVRATHMDKRQVEYGEGELTAAPEAGPATEKKASVAQPIPPKPESVTTTGKAATQAKLKESGAAEVASMGKQQAISDTDTISAAALEKLKFGKREPTPEEQAATRQKLMTTAKTEPAKLAPPAARPSMVENSIKKFEDALGRYREELKVLEAREAKVGFRLKEAGVLRNTIKDVEGRIERLRAKLPPKSEAVEPTPPPKEQQ